MNKSIRNKAYAGTEFFTCDFNGQDWLTNTYFAEPDTTEPRITTETKRRNTNGQKPLLGKIVDIDKHELSLMTTGKTETTVSLTCSTKSNTIQRRYFDYFTNRFPKAEFKTGVELRYEPISVYNEDQLIGIIMPLKD